MGRSKVNLRAVTAAVSMRGMTRARLVLTLMLALATIISIWLWWVHPISVDMAAYAPAESLLYVEANSPTAIVDALEGTDVWKLVDSSAGENHAKNPNRWFQKFVRWTGLGPTNSVILARSQLAVVITDLGVKEDGETLTIKPEGALIVETHTSKGRIQQPTEQALQRFADKIYGRTTFRRTTIDDQEIMEWLAQDGVRKIVSTVLGTVVIVGNAERPVQKVLSVILKRQSSLLNDGELSQLRLKLDAGHSLALGYVPSQSSPHLLSVGVPMVLGRAPDNAELGRLINSSAAKIIGSLGWSSHPFKGGMEDRYLIGVQPAVMTQVKDAFAVNSTVSSSLSELRQGVVSESSYRFEDPAKSWQGLRTAVSSHVDAVSAILFSSLLRSALLPYGINEPEKFLGLVKSPITTVRMEGSPTALLIASTRDDAAIRELLVTTLGYKSNASGEPVPTFFNAENESAARLSNGSIMIGSREDIERYTELMKTTSTATSYDVSSRAACVVTYADDSTRVRAFIATLMSTRGGPGSLTARQEAQISSLPYSTTETVLDETGFARTTRSPLGQFSTILPLIFPERLTTSTAP